MVFQFSISSFVRSFDTEWPKTFVWSETSWTQSAKSIFGISSSYRYRIPWNGSDVWVISRGINSHKMIPICGSPLSSVPNRSVIHSIGGEIAISLGYPLTREFFAKYCQRILWLRLSLTQSSEISSEIRTNVLFMFSIDLQNIWFKSAFNYITSQYRTHEPM